MVALGGLGRLKEKVEEVKFNWDRAEIRATLIDIGIQGYIHGS